TQSDSDTSESDDDPDDYWLKVERKRYIISKSSDLLFENWVEELKQANITLTGTDGDLRKEVSMNLLKRKGSPYYYIDICLNGVRFRRSTHTSNKADAQRIASQMLNKLWSIQNTGSSPDVPAFKQASEKFVEYQKNKGLRSWERELLCHKHLVPYLGNRKVSEIRPKIIQETLTRIKIAKNLSPRSLDYLRGYLHRFFEYERRIEEHVQNNPVEMVERIKYDNIRKHILEVSQQKLFLDNIDDPVVKDAVIFILFTGLRQGELLNLKKQDFKKVDDILYFVIQREKTPEVTTEFPLVWDIPRQIVEKYLALTRGVNLFCYEDGRALDKHNLIYQIKKARKKAGIEKLCCNDLRRTFCTRMRMAGCDYEVREYLMGHKIPGSSSHYSIYNVQNIAENLKNLEKNWHKFGTLKILRGEKCQG
ncbi:MAG: tyrosine-type recombinase/integrase, partial [bacterium]|nr:tyrosine-type recombinase/integrase [bacterium]